jgi:hypothetical protein
MTQSFRPNTSMSTAQGCQDFPRDDDPDGEGRASKVVRCDYLHLDHVTQLPRTS